MKPLVLNISTPFSDRRLPIQVDSFSGSTSPKRSIAIEPTSSSCSCSACQNLSVLNGISVPHDRVGGRRFGMATVWVWEQNNLKIVHMGGAAGDIEIDSQIILSRPDILFISVGGGIKSYNGEEASRIVMILKPNVVIPVHIALVKIINKECDFSNADLFIENMKNFKVKYVGEDFQIKPKRIDQNTIYIFGN